MSPEENQYEAGLKFAVSFKKNIDFIGKKAIEKIKNEKIKKMMIMLTLKNNKPGSPLLLHDEPIYYDGKIVGRTTSGNYSFNYEKNMSFGYLNLVSPIEELAKKLAMPLDRVRIVLKISKEPVSLETPVGDEEDSSLGDFIEDQNALQPLDASIRSNLGESTTKILATLTPREERVLRMRFGIGMNTDHTLEEVGLQFSVTRERIRQIEAKALRKLKHPSRSKHLKSFLEK